MDEHSTHNSLRYNPYRTTTTSVDYDEVEPSVNELDEVVVTPQDTQDQAMRSERDMYGY
jgi:hypothetical protein